MACPCPNDVPQLAVVAVNDPPISIGNGLHHVPQFWERPDPPIREEVELIEFEVGATEAEGQIPRQSGLA